MPDPIRFPIRIGSETLARTGPDDSCTPACFWAGPVWPKPNSQPEPNRIRAGFAQYDPGRLWQNATESERGKLVAGRLWKNATESESGKLVAGRLNSGRTGHDDFGTRACFRTGSVWPNHDQASRSDPGRFCTNMIRAVFGITETNRMRKVGSDIIMRSGPILAAHWP